MPVAKQPSKFQFVGDFFVTHPDASAAEAVEAAARVGLDVGVKYARQIRSKTLNSRKKKSKKVKKRQPPRKKAVHPSRDGGHKAADKKNHRSVVPAATPDLHHDPILEAVRFIRRVGGVEQARLAMQRAECILAEVEHE